MGILRFLLAISVVITHTNMIFGFGLVGGPIAVQSFYIISGFYMTLILNEKYIGQNKSYKLFISNRLLRLFPIYWVILILTILASLGAYLFTSGGTAGKLQPYIENIGAMDLKSVSFLIVSNIILLFQDFVMFLGIDITSGNLFFTQNFEHTSPQLHTFLLVPQAWTIGLEITFYLIAPFILRKKLSTIILVIFMSFMLRVILYQNGLNHAPWTYRFFPTEIFFFLLGTVAYHIYKKIESVNMKKSLLLLIFGIILLFTFSYSWISIPYKMCLYLFVFFLSLPFVFVLSKKWKKDRYIGELSYPIYISHVLVSYIIVYTNISTEGKHGLVTIIFTMIISVLLNELIAKKVELFRQRRIKPVVKNNHFTFNN